MFQNLPLPVMQEVHDSIDMKNDGVSYHQVSSFSPEHWKKVVLQEHAVVGNIYCLPWRYSVVQYYPINVICHNDHHLHRTLFRVHSFDWRFKFGSYERAHISSVATIRPRKSSHSLWYQSNMACATA